MPERTTTVHISFSGGSSEEVFEQIARAAAGQGGNPLDKLSTEALLQELRDRCAKNGQVVKIVPFEKQETSDPGPGNGTPAEQPKRRGRPPKAETVQREPEPETPASGEKADGGTVLEAEKAGEPATLDDVKSALNAFAAVHGQVNARAIMQRVGGSPALKDIPSEKWRELIDKLNAAREQKQAA